MKKKEKKIEKEYDTIEYDPKEIKRMKREIDFFGVDRKKNSIKEIKKEMDERGVGYMSNWSKNVLIKRLEEEDERDAILISIMQEKKHFLDTREERVLEVERRIKLLNRGLKTIKEDVLENQRAHNVLIRERNRIREELKEAEQALVMVNL